MYHKTAEQLAKEFVVIPDPRLDEAAKSAKLIVEEFGPVEVIDNHVKAHMALGKILEDVDRTDTQGIAACLAVMAFIEEVMASAIIGEDKITIIKIK
jgi:hypothetical protein